MILVVWLGCAPAPSPRTPPPREVVLADRAALQRVLTEPSDRVRVVNFWATWCGPCKAEMPVLRAWGRAHPDVDLVFVDLDLPKLAKTTVEPFVEAQDLWGFRHYLLDDRDPMLALPALIPGWPDQVPVTLVVAPDGAVARMYDHALREGELTTD